MPKVSRQQSEHAPLPAVDEARRALAEVVAAARRALAEGRPEAAMVAIGRAALEHGNDFGPFRAQLAGLARRAVRAAMPDRTHRILH